MPGWWRPDHGVGGAVLRLGGRREPADDRRPTTDDTAATAKAGCLLVLDRRGRVRKTITDSINGPWDMTAADHGATADLQVSNALDTLVVLH